MQKYTKNKEREAEFKKVLGQIPKHTTGILYIAQRFGKTRLMLSHIRRAGYKNVLWVAKEKSFITNGLHQDMEKFGFEKLKSKITCQTWASLHKTVGKYDLIVLDEIQSITERNSITLCDGSLKGRYMIGMSGSKTRDKIKKEIIYEILALPIILEYDIKQAVNNNIIADYDIEVYKIPLSTKRDIPIKTKNTSFMTSEYSNYNYLTAKYEKAVFNRDFRLAKFLAIKRSRELGTLKSKLSIIPSLISGRTLIFVETRDIAEKFKYFYHGTSTNKYLKAFENNKIRYLVLVKKGGVGYNFHNIDTVIITKTDSDNNGITVQKIMRGFINDRKVTVKLLCSKGTQDEVNTNKVLENFDKNKIKYYDV